MKNFELRNWQKKSIKKIDSAFDSKNHKLISLAASVGSGKIFMAAYSFGKFIIDNMINPTVQVFVAPRIDLCKQQINEIKKCLSNYFHLENGKHFNIRSINCRHDNSEFNRKNIENINGHNIFVICDESLWGSKQIDKNVKKSRYYDWESVFKKLERKGVKFGTIFYDEAHNYENQVKRKIITDQTLIK